MHIHLGGSLGRPFNQNDLSFGSRTFLEESLDAGSIVVQPAYHNRFAINSSSECGGNTDVNNCAGLVREEKVTGANLTSVSNVPEPDSINYRLIAIENYLESKNFNFPVKISDQSTVQWQGLSVGGHSQGAGQALYIGKVFGAKSVCLIGGAYDLADEVPTTPTENIADWYLNTNFTTPKSNFFAFFAADDSNNSEFTAALNLLGISFVTIENPPYFDWDSTSIDAHAASIRDPRFRQNRRDACFR